MKIGHHFQAKKTSATPKFCKRNFSPMHDVGYMNFLSLIAPIFEVKKPGFGTLRGKMFIWEESVLVHSVYNTIEVQGEIIAL